MNIIVLIVSLIAIGVLSYLGGKIADIFKLPSLIGMMIVGMLMGPSFLNIVPIRTLNIATYIKDIALVTVLFIGGLGISYKQMKEIGRPAILLSTVPAILEGLTIALLSMILLDFTFVQGTILGFIIAAVSPAVLIPSMVDLINRKIGQDKAIPQMLLVGASADDTVAITIFTTALSVYLSSINGKSTSILKEILTIPLIILFSIGIGFVLAMLTKNIIKKIHRNSLKVWFVMILCITMRIIENKGYIHGFNSLLVIMIYGFFLRTYLGEIALGMQTILNKVWIYGKLYLFAFVGMVINPNLVGEYFFIGVIMLLISLIVRSTGVLISLIGTNLTFKERVFCVIAYLPKATVQSAKAGVPLQYGVVGGEVMQALAILSVLITAPIGAIGIKITSKKFLKQDTPT